MPTNQPTIYLTNLQSPQHMPRLHLWEIHEQAWCPTPIRDGATDCLRVVATVGHQYKYVAPLLQDALFATGATQIVDLCAGGGGPWIQLGPMLQTNAGEPVPILLTDLYPHQVDTVTQAEARRQLQFVTTPVDATQLPPDLLGFRTLFTAFHHFPPAQAQAILQDAVNAGQGIAIFEQTARTPLALLMMYLLPWLAWLAVFFIRPWRLSRFFWTFVIPAIPLVLWFDGMVSCLRTYSAAELTAMVSTLHPAPDGTDYVWQIGAVRSPLSPLGVSYLIGHPARV